MKNQQPVAVNISLADYHNPADAGAIVALMNEYALDKMGGGEPLPEYVQNNLVSEMAKVGGAFTVLAWADDQPVGLINCLMGFSTFKAKPLVNIHDVIVSAKSRGLGISVRMLERVELEAQRRGCCKLTLEVLQGNTVAQNAYVKFGFAGYELDPDLGGAMFWQKPL